MRTAIYARVSTDKQGRDQTIDSQLDALRRWATAHGHDLKDDHIYIDEGYSGARLDRPALDRLRDAAREGEFDVIAVYTPDRLARRYAYQVLLLEEFRRAACTVEFIERPISDDPHDQLLLQIQGAIAEYERAVLAERFRRGKLQKARAGQWGAGRAPYGYRYVPKRDGVPGYLVIDEAEAEVVRRLYRWLIDERTTVRQILKRLADGPWRPRNGKRLWSNSVVHRILSDPLYKGTAYANRNELVAPRKPRSTGLQAGLPTCRKPRPREEWIPIPVPAIIDEMTHPHASEQLARNSTLSFRNNTRNDYLLRCLLTCRTCGLAMFGVTTSGASGRRMHRYYMCHGKDTVARDRECRCPQARTKVEELDAAVWGHVKRLLDDPAMLAAQFEERARQAAALGADADVAGQKCEAQLRRLDREEQRLVDAYQAEHVVDKPRGEIEEELAIKRVENPFDAHAVFEDPLQDQVPDLVVVLGLGEDTLGCGAEGGGAVAAGLVFAVGDFEEGDGFVRDGANGSLQGPFASSEFAAVWTGGFLGGVAHRYNQRCGYGYIRAHACVLDEAVVIQPYSPGRKLYRSSPKRLTTVGRVVGIGEKCRKQAILEDVRPIVDTTFIECHELWVLEPRQLKACWWAGQTARWLEGFQAGKLSKKSESRNEGEYSSSLSCRKDCQHAVSVVPKLVCLSSSTQVHILHLFR
jgi:site-specific DNA recombinase